MFKHCVVGIGLKYTASYWPTLPTFNKSLISLKSCLQSINRSTDSTHRSVTNINMNPIVRLRARIIQFAKRQLHGIIKCRVSGKRKRRPAGIRILCCTATVFSRLNTAAGICVTEMFEICQATFVFVWCVCVCVCVFVGGWGVLIHMDWSHLA